MKTHPVVLMLTSRRDYFGSRRILHQVSWMEFSSFCVILLSNESTNGNLSNCNFIWTLSYQEEGGRFSDGWAGWEAKYETTVCFLFQTQLENVGGHLDILQPYLWGQNRVLRQQHCLNMNWKMKCFFVNSLGKFCGFGCLTRCPLEDGNVFVRSQ